MYKNLKKFDLETHSVQQQLHQLMPLSFNSRLKQFLIRLIVSKVFRVSLTQGYVCMYTYIYTRTEWIHTRIQKKPTKTNDPSCFLPLTIENRNSSTCAQERNLLSNKEGTSGQFDVFELPSRFKLESSRHVLTWPRKQRTGHSHFQRFRPRAC